MYVSQSKPFQRFWHVFQIQLQWRGFAAGCRHRPGRVGRLEPCVSGKRGVWCRDTDRRGAGDGRRHRSQWRDDALLRLILIYSRATEFGVSYRCKNRWILITDQILELTGTVQYHNDLRDNACQPVIITNTKWSRLGKKAEVDWFISLVVPNISIKVSF